MIAVCNKFDTISETIFHHLGLLTDNPNAAATVLNHFGYSVDPPVTDPLQDVELRMAKGGLNTANIEIITPISSQSPLAQLLRRRNDYMYHSCFSVRNVEDVITTIMASGLRITIVSPSKPAILFGGKLVSFYLIDGLGLVEFIENE